MDKPRQFVSEADWLEQTEPVIAPVSSVADPKVGVDVSEADYVEQVMPAYVETSEEE